MSAELDIIQKQRNSKRIFLSGCGLFILVGLIGAASILIFLLARDRQAVRYPGSAAISSHNNYQGLPFEYRTDNSYKTFDNFTDVYNWYSVTFDLGAEARAIGECTLLEGTNQGTVVIRHLSVFLCSTNFGQMIYVTRSTSVSGRITITDGFEELGRSLLFR